MRDRRGWKRGNNIYLYISFLPHSPNAHACVHAAFSTAFSEDKFPLLHSYISHMFEDEAVKQTTFRPEQHLAFMMRMHELGGQHDYSLADMTGKGLIIYTKKV